MELSDQMWRVATEDLRDGKARKYVLSDLPYHGVLKAWRTDQEFRAFFSLILADCPYDAFTWETPPITGRTLDSIFEFVVIKSKRLERIKRASFSAFSDRLESTPETILAFTNRSQDASLVIPRARTADLKPYAHLGHFVRRAQPEEKHEFWQQVAKTVDSHLSVKPLWLSTSKKGPPWLHVRVDSTPKHYRHGPYREFQEGPIWEEG